MPDGSNVVAPAAEATDTLDFVTILTSVDGRPLTKQFYYDDDGQLALRSYTGAKYYRMTRVFVRGIGDLFSLFTNLKPSQHPVNGDIIEGTDTERARRVHRLDKVDEIEDENGAIETVPVPPTLRETTHHWLAQDFDGVDAVDDDGPIDQIVDPERAVARLVKDLPPEFQVAECIWQHTSSAGRKPGINMRLYWWLDRPITSSAAKAWMAPFKDTVRVDTSIYTPSQPIYAVKPPLADGVDDPVAQRFGYAGLIGPVSPPENIVPLTDNGSAKPTHRIKDQTKHKAPGSFVPDTEEVKARARAYLEHTADTGGGWGETDPHTTTYDVAAMLGDIGCTEQTALALMLEMSPRKLPASEVTWLMTQVRNAYSFRQNEIGCGAPNTPERDNAKGWEKYGDPDALRQGENTGDAGEQDDKQARQEQAAKDRERVAKGKWPLTHILDRKSALAQPDPVMLVEKIIPDQKLIIPWGDTGCGKTYWSAEVVTAVAMRRPAFGRFNIVKPGQPGIAVVFAGEDADFFNKSRLTAIERRYDQSLQGLVYVVDRAIPIAESELDLFKEYRDELRRLQDLTGKTIDIIANDTLKRSLGPLKQNDDDVGRRFGAAMEGLIEEFKCVVICNAHQPKSGPDGGIAGSGDFTANCPVTPHLIGEKHPVTKQLERIYCEFTPKFRVGPVPNPFKVKCEPVRLPQPVAGNFTDVVLLAMSSEEAAATSPARQARIEENEERRQIVEALHKLKAHDLDSGVSMGELVNALVGPARKGEPGNEYLKRCQDWKNRLKNGSRSRSQRNGTAALPKYEGLYDTDYRANPDKPERKWFAPPLDASIDEGQR